MKLTEAISKVDELHEKWQSLQPLSKDAADKLWQKLRLEWNFNSNHIEGNTLTYGETKLLLMFDKTTGDHLLREYEEMKAHDLAVHMVKDWAADAERELTEADIRELNKVILVKPFWKEALTRDGDSTRRMIDVGTYKKHPNSVLTATGEIVHYASPEETPQLMTDLMDWYRKNQDVHPAILAAEMHYRFIRIHPFDDGNGRIARLLVNYILMRNNYPPTVIKSENKKAYLTALQKADAGDREAFQAYLAEQVIWSLQMGIRAGEGKSVEEEEDLDKEVKLLKRQQKSYARELAQKDDDATRLLKTVFLPLLMDLSPRLEKISELFEKSGWKFLRNPAVAGEMAIEQSISELNDTLNTFAENRGKVFQVTYYFHRYEGKPPFSFELGLRMHCHSKGAGIKAFVGGNRGSFQTTLMRENLNNIKSPRLYDLAQIKPDDAISEDEITSWSKRLKSEVLENVKQLAK